MKDERVTFGTAREAGLALPREEEAANDASVSSTVRKHEFLNWALDVKR